MKLKLREIDLLLIDGEYVAHRAHYAFTKGEPHEWLQTASGLLSGCFYGFFQILLRKIQDYSPKRVVVCWGDKRGNLKRRQIFADYKAQRDAAPIALLDQVADIQASLFCLGIEQFTSAGYEADDVIATIVQQQFEPENICNDSAKCVIVSGDKDLLQLINKQVFVVSPASGFVKSDIEYNEDKVEEKYGVSVKMLADYLTLLGDKVDNIPGVEGVGEKTAAKLLNDNGPIYDWFSKTESIQASEKVKQKLSQSRKQMVISKKLISLKDLNVPLDKVKTWLSVVIQDDDDMVLERGAVQDIFDKYEMKKIRPEMFL